MKIFSPVVPFLVVVVVVVVVVISLSSHTFFFFLLVCLFLYEYSTKQRSSDFMGELVGPYHNPQVTKMMCTNIHDKHIIIDQMSR